MSAYIQFFIRHGDSFLPIGSFSRSNEIYQQFSESISWGQIRPISRPLLYFIGDNVNDCICYTEREIQRIEDNKAFIATFNNSADEKMKMIGNANAVKEEYVRELEELRYTRHYIDFLLEIIDSVDFNDDFDYKNYLYAGIEVGSPTIDDIVRY